MSGGGLGRLAGGRGWWPVSGGPRAWGRVCTGGCRAGGVLGRASRFAASAGSGRAGATVAPPSQPGTLASGGPAVGPGRSELTPVGAEPSSARPVRDDTAAASAGRRPSGRASAGPAGAARRARRPAGRSWAGTARRRACTLPAVPAASVPPPGAAPRSSCRLVGPSRAGVLLDSQLPEFAHHAPPLRYPARRDRGGRGLPEAAGHRRGRPDRCRAAATVTARRGRTAAQRVRRCRTCAQRRFARPRRVEAGGGQP